MSSLLHIILTERLYNADWIRTARLVDKDTEEAKRELRKRERTRLISLNEARRRHDLEPIV